MPLSAVSSTRILGRSVGTAQPVVAKLAARIPDRRRLFAAWRMLASGRTAQSTGGALRFPAEIVRERVFIEKGAR